LPASRLRRQKQHHDGSTGRRSSDLGELERKRRCKAGEKQLHLDQGIAVTSQNQPEKDVDQVIASAPVRSFSQANEAQFYLDSGVTGFYFLIRDLYFRFSDGVPFQWADITDHGVVYYAKPGFGADGGPLVRVTADNFKKLRNLTGGMNAVNPEQVEWFSPNTGDASTYHFKSAAGDLEFYDRWAHHPSNGQELKPVTPEVRAECDAWKKEGPERELRLKSAQAQLEQLKAADDARDSSEPSNGA
jgi:hypothetical protein